MSWKLVNPGGEFRVVVTKELPGDRWLSALTRSGCEVQISTSKEIHTVQEIREVIGTKCHGAIGQLTEPWSAELFGALKDAGGTAYSNYAVGYNNVVVEEATSRGIAVGNTPGVLTETTAEMAVALLFAAARRVTEAENYLREGKFRGWLPDLFLGKRLWGATLGILGAGRIGAALARMVAPGHDMDLVYHDVQPNEPLESYFADLNEIRKKSGERALRCERLQSVEDVLKTANIVSLHVPLDASTKHLINRERLAIMKPDAILVNTSRGPVIDEKALVTHLRDQPEFYCGLDVFEEEPTLAPGLNECSNAVIVPHIASATHWTRAGMATLAACNVAAILRGDPVTKELRVEEFLEGNFPRKAPSIVNAGELGLATA